MSEPEWSDTCTAAGCRSKKHAKNLCSLHYSRWRKWGDVAERPVDLDRHVNRHSMDRATNDDYLKRLRSLLVTRESGCWEIVETSRNRINGYGKMSFRGKVWRAHRLMYFLTNGPIPDGMFILHACDNPPCCNPNHLRAGTRQENAIDSVERNRHASTRKTHCPQGHAYAEHAYVFAGKGNRQIRMCRICKLERTARADAKRDRHVGT